MENNVNRLPYEGEERVVPGIIGALLFSLAGGVVWFLLWQVNVVAGLSGLVGVFCAIKGYEIFAKKSSVKGVIIAFVCALAVIFFAWYLCIGFDFYQAMKEVAEEAGMASQVVLGDYLFEGFEILELCDAMGMPEVSSEYVSNLVFGIVFTVLGGVGYIVQAVKASKQAPAAPASPSLNGEDGIQE